MTQYTPSSTTRFTLYIRCGKYEEQILGLTSAEVQFYLKKYQKKGYSLVEIIDETIIRK
jgi:hypothetical protein